MELQDSVTRARVVIPEPIAGVLAGLVAGTAYLVAQLTLAGLPHGIGPAPLQRIAAILMGPDVAPPPAEWEVTVIGMALLIHFGLAIVFGRFVSQLVWKRSLAAAIAIGCAVGVALFLVDFELLAPSAFPWFDASPRAVTLIDHLLFGGIAAATCVVLRDRR
jgi:hypothetical protein